MGPPLGIGNEGPHSSPPASGIGIGIGDSITSIPSFLLKSQLNWWCNQIQQRGTELNWTELCCRNNSTSHDITALHCTHCCCMYHFSTLTAARFDRLSRWWPSLTAHVSWAFMAHGLFSIKNIGLLLPAPPIHMNCSLHPHSGFLLHNCLIILKQCFPFLFLLPFSLCFTL